jgi:hypothetical protein
MLVGFFLRELSHRPATSDLGGLSLPPRVNSGKIFWVQRQPVAVAFILHFTVQIKGRLKNMVNRLDNFGFVAVCHLDRLSP